MEYFMINKGIDVEKLCERCAVWKEISTMIMLDS